MILAWLILSLSLQAGLVAWKLMQGWEWGWLIILEVPTIALIVVGLVVAVILSPGVMGTRR